MKTPLPAALCLFLLFLAAAVPPVEAQPVATTDANLLRNPGLEMAGAGSLNNNPLPDWSIFQSDRQPGTVVFSFTGESVYEGRRALLIEIKKPQATAIYQMLPVRPETFYSFSVRVKTDSLVSSGIGVHLFVPGLNAVSSDFSGTTNGWGELRLYFKTAPGQTETIGAVRVGSVEQPAQGRVWLDDVSLVKTDGPPPAALAPAAAATGAREAAFPRPGAGWIVFIILACLLLALFVWLTVQKKPVLKDRGLDLVLAGGLTLIYAFIAFYHLGTSDSPQTYYRAHQEGESFTMDLGAVRPVSRIMYFMALGDGSYRVDFSDDLRYWRDPKNLEQETRYSQIHWRMENVGFKTRYLRVTAVRPGSLLGEIAVFSDEDGSRLPIRAVLPGTGSGAPAQDPGRVYDEQERVPLLPSYLNGTYFDECYFARSAWQYTLGMDAHEESHPPLGKLTMALGIKLFGFTPFGWRFMGTLFGILMIPVSYAFGLALFKKREWAFVGAFLLAFDFMHFTQTRIATIDVFGVFWIMLMYWFMYRALREDPFTRRPGKLLVNLLLSGLCFGIGAASKWIALYGAVGLAVALITRYASASIEHFRGLRRPPTADTAPVGERAGDEADTPPPLSARSLPSHAQPWLRRTGLIFSFSVLVFIILPAGIYLASYIPFMAARGPANPHTSPLQLVVKEQQLMYDYHAAQDALHDFSSPWYEWPVVYRPMWFYSGNRYLFPDTVSDIFSFGNPAIWWPGIAATGALIFLLAASLTGTRRDVRRRTPAGLFILIALAAQYLPWIIIPRTQTFIYHFFAAVPFLILAVVFVFKTLVEKKPGLRWVVFGYLGIVMLLFFLFYPLLSGARADAAFVNEALKWFPPWFPLL